MGKMLGRKQKRPLWLLKPARSGKKIVFAFGNVRFCVNGGP
jgi:hypothetical protein